MGRRAASGGCAAASGAGSGGRDRLRSVMIAKVETK
jgi:hypothetical protein